MYKMKKFLKNLGPGLLFAVIQLAFIPGIIAQDPNLPPGENFDLTGWKITLPDGTEVKEQELSDGFESENEFYTDPCTGAMVFRCPNHGATTVGSSFPRSELRQMLRAGNTSISTRGIGLNNWVFSSSTYANQLASGGVDGALTATVAVDYVSATGESGKVGRVIIGQIHASDDEPCRLYYLKLPGHTKGSIYFAHEPTKRESLYYEMIGSMSSSTSDPVDGIALGERFSYEIKVVGDTLTVTIMRPGKKDVRKTVDMSASGYADDWMYFKAGAYNQNNTGDEGDYCQVSFFALRTVFSENALPGYVNYPGYPSDVISFFDQWKITLGDGTSVDNLVNYEHEDYFYNANDGIDWVVYKTPNSGGTTPTSSNTRSELRQFSEWTAETGGKLTGTLKVMHVSTTGDARIPAAFSVIVGQIHSSEGHENEPIKIFYKKFPGHTKGSVYWNYEINTEGDNGGRWDYSTAVWGYNYSVVGSSATTYPEEPEDGIELGEEFSYEINVYNGIMYVTFKSEGHRSKTYTKSLISSDYTNYSDIPGQVLTVYSSTGQDGTEKSDAYAGELLYFKQGAYNQTNGKDPEENMVWNTGAETYKGDLANQYANGSYAEVWFKEATVGAGTDPGITGL